MTPRTRPVSWIRAALANSSTSRTAPGPSVSRRKAGKPILRSPCQGWGSGVFEIALPFRGDAFRVIYAVQLAQEIWVVHAFQKRSTQGIRTPKHEIDLIKNRLKRLKEMLR